MHRILRVAVLGVLGTLVLTSCGQSDATQTPLPTSRKLGATPTPTADIQRVDIVNSGVGVYQLVTVPVIVIHNVSGAAAALGVFATFTPRRADNSALLQVTSPPVNLQPGGTVALAANCTDSCVGATHTDAKLTIGSWGDVAQSPIIQAFEIQFTRGGGKGAGFGNVAATLQSVNVPASAAITVTAICFTGATPIGGGSATSTWDVPAEPQPTKVSVIVSATPTSCDLYAATSG